MVFQRKQRPQTENIFITYDIMNYKTRLASMKTIEPKETSCNSYFSEIGVKIH